MYQSRRICGIREGFPEKVTLVKEKWVVRGEENMMCLPFRRKNKYIERWSKRACQYRG